MFVFAKVIQALGVADVGYALYVGLTEEHAMGRELYLMLLGFAIFTVGRSRSKRADWPSRRAARHSSSSAKPSSW